MTHEQQPFNPKRLFFFKDFLDLIFPQNCVSCGRNLFDWELSLCGICKNKLPVSSYHLRPLDNDLTQKLQGLCPVSRCISFLKFSRKGMSQKLLHTLKYRNKPELGRVLGNLFGKTLIETDFAGTWDAIVPVPLHPQKLKRRGYNQSEEFAKGIAEVLAISVENCLERRKWTETQTNKSRIERIENVSGVFEIKNTAQILGKNLLLVDDVITTGATLAASATILWENGAKTVDLATIAAGGGY